MVFHKDWIVYSKHANWGGGAGDVWLDVYGEDLTGATFSWAFGAAHDLVTDFVLTNATAGSEGISTIWFPNAVWPATNAVTGKTRITPQINTATLVGLTFTGTSDLTLSGTLYATISGIKRVIGTATLTIQQGIDD